jgi:acetyl esterase/lipase
MSWQAVMLKIFMAPMMSYIAKGSSVIEQRAKFEKFSSMTKLSKDVEVKPQQVNGVQVEWIRTPQVSPDHVILYLHGGGYTMGLFNSHRDFISRLGRASGMGVLAVDYRLAPEHPFPAGLEDATIVYRWLVSKGYESTSIILAGESSGGGLALATLIKLRDDGDHIPTCTACFSPQTDMALTGESVMTKAKADVINRPFDISGNAARYAGKYDLKGPLVSPFYADLKGLPPIMIHVGTEDILLDDSIRFANAARDAGVDIILEVWPGMPHAFPLQAAFLPEARKAIEATAAYIRAKIDERVISHD